MTLIGSRLRRILSHLRRVEQRGLADLRRWLEETRNFIHVSLFVLAPLLLGLVTYISNIVDLLPFLLFPPLASGTYTLFVNPESKYASPRRFVGGMTTGALCGWVALELTARYWYHVPPEAFRVHPGAAALGVLLTGVVTWTFNLEESQAFSTALLVLVVGVTQPVYVVSVFASSALVAGVFVLWRREVYEQRADYLYQTVQGDDNILVPMRGETAETVASFGAQLAVAHEAGTVVLMSVVSPEGETAEKTSLRTDGGDTTAQRGTPADAIPVTAHEVAERLDAHADRIEDRFDVPCEVVVASGDLDDSQPVVQTARQRDCDLIVTPYEVADGKLSRFVRELFATPLDVVVVRTDGIRDEWPRILAPIKYPGDVAHAILDFADRLAGDGGMAAVCHCTETEGQRRTAEKMLANLTETFERAFETRVTTVPIEEFLAANAENYDLTIIGSSTERTLVSRFIDPPTFKCLADLDCDIAIVHRGGSPSLFRRSATG